MEVIVSNKNNNDEIVEVNDSKLVSISEAAEIYDVTRQAIYVAIKLNKLKAKKDRSRWTINLDDLEEYRRQRYSRMKSTFQGEPLYDNEKGYFSIYQTAKILNVPSQKIYYATRTGMLRGTRKGAAWIIHSDDIVAYQQQYLVEKESNDQKLGG
jgi:excisionase family DNA binding protein